jgi:hypothetical protein
MKNKRKIFALLSFFVLFTLFVAVSIYVIILAQGRKIDSDGRIVSTSIIRINSVPSDVEVFINDQKVPKVENRVEWLEPGNVNLTLKKDGYKSWEKTIKLQPGVVADIYAQLFPERIDFEKITNTNVDNISFSKNSDFIFYSVTQNSETAANGIWRLKLNRNIFDFGSETPTKVHDFSVQLSERLKSERYTLRVSNDNNRIAVHFSDSQDAVIINLSNSSFFNLKEEIGFNIKNILWMDNSLSLLIEGENILSLYDLNSQTSTLINYSNEGNAYAKSGNAIYYLKQAKNEIYKFENNNSTLLSVSNDFIIPENTVKVFAPENNSDIIVLETLDSIFFIDVQKKYFKEIFETGEIHKISPNGTVIVYKDEQTLNTLHFKETVNKTSYDVETFKLDLNVPEVKDLFFSSSSRTIVTINETSEIAKKNVSFMDYDGENKSVIVEDEFMVTSKTHLAANGTDLYVVLQDSNIETDINTRLSNVYRYSLEIE